MPFSNLSSNLFKHNILGKGVAIVPKFGIVVAPSSGVINIIYQKSNVVGLITDEGVEILIHIGIDSDSTDLELFTPHVVEGQRVNKGDTLVEFDIETVISTGIDITSPIIITNTDAYEDIFHSKDVKASLLENIISIYSKEI
ncbi:MAG: hypothetical protein GX038_05090 [Erysipelothrix sp.]|nr:hypothetical protein [Erysipelothrix sp.]